MIDGPITSGRYRWTIVAFALAGILIGAFAGWQLYETTPARWCAIAKIAADGDRAGCVSILLRLLDIKDHAVIGLLIILGLTILSVVAVALGVNIKGTAPGGTSVDIGAVNTTVTTADTEVKVPTPPSEA